MAGARRARQVVFIRSFVTGDASDTETALDRLKRAAELAKSVSEVRARAAVAVLMPRAGRNPASTRCCGAILAWCVLAAAAAGG